MESFQLLSIVAEVDTEPLSGGSMVVLVCLFVFILFSALLSASETALSTLSGNKGNNGDTIPTSLSIWSNLINILIIALGLGSLSQTIALPLSPAWATVVQVSIVAFVVFFFCHLIPRQYASSKPEWVINRTEGLVKALDRLVRPISLLLVKSERKININPKKKAGDISVDELSKALELTSPELSDEKEMLEGIIGLYNKTAVEIMTSRLDISHIEESSTFKEIISLIVEVGYSRIPVYGEDQDDIKGILYIKDLLPFLNESESFQWQKLIRPAFFVPETKKIDDLLEEFRSNKIHMAIVVDEFGGTSGIVTLEDILEEIVGEISDEYDEDEEKKCILQPDGSHICDAKVLLTDFFKSTGIDPKEFGKLTEEVDTLAGLVLEIKGDFPEENETVIYKRYAFHVLEMDDKRISKIQFTVNELQEGDMD